MAIIRCKICGGSLSFEAGNDIGVCENCGTKQTLPRMDDERRLRMYDRANHFRRNGDFDKAIGIFEEVLLEDNSDAEAYWSLVLCKYGISYVEDTKTHTMIPTCNRMLRTSIYADEDYKKTIEIAPAYTRMIYEQEAAKISEIQNRYMAISQKEKPYDVFISYKDTDKTGSRTEDSVIAQQIYDELSKNGYRVFYSRISLENKLGENYEAIIYSALTSAKVMIVVATSSENVNSTWVKNEWSRFLTMMKTDSTKHIIPAYCRMDPYEFPDEFANLYLQSQDMTKIGALQDLNHGVRKLCGSSTVNARKEHSEYEKTVLNQNDALLKRMFIFLGDGEFSNARMYANRVLDTNPYEAKAYIGLLMSDKKLPGTDAYGLIYCDTVLDKCPDFNKAMEYASDTYRAELDDVATQVLEKFYQKFLSAYSAKVEEIEQTQGDAILYEGNKLLDNLDELASQFIELGTYKESQAYVTEIKHRVNEICFKMQVVQERLNHENAVQQKRIADAENAKKLAEQERLKAEKKKLARKRTGGYLILFAYIGVALFLTFSPEWFPGVDNDGQFILLFLSICIASFVFGLVGGIFETSEGMSAVWVTTCVIHAIAWSNEWGKGIIDFPVLLGAPVLGVSTGFLAVIGHEIIKGAKK